MKNISRRKRWTTRFGVRIPRRQSCPSKVRGKKSNLEMALNIVKICKQLEHPPHSVRALQKLLTEAAECLSEVNQGGSADVVTEMKIPIHAFVKRDILRHNDRDVRILVAICIGEIMRITVPEIPYSDDDLREILHLMVVVFHGLHDIGSPSFPKIVELLESFAKLQLCVAMLDFQCDDLILEMFNMFFSIVRKEHQRNVHESIHTIMVALLNESDIISEQLVSVLLCRLGREDRESFSAAYSITKNVVKDLEGKLEENVCAFLTSAMSEEKKSQYNLWNDYHEIIFSIYMCAPKMLHSLIPKLNQFLLSGDLDVRLNSVKLVGRILAIQGPLAEEFQPLISEFLKRFEDKSVEVRLGVLKYAKECLLLNPFRHDASYIIAAVRDRLLDSEETIRKQVVEALCDIENCTLKAIPLDTIRQVADCLHDKAVSVRKCTLEKLAEIYRLYCSNYFDGCLGNFELDWIPGKVLRSISDKDFRLQSAEVAFFESIFPSDFPLSERVKHWITLISKMEEPEVKALKEILAQKKRFQLEMQRFLLSWGNIKEDESTQLQNIIPDCFRIISLSFEDPIEHKEMFLNLIHKDNKHMWEALSSLLDPSLTFIHAQSIYDDLLKQIGERHPHYKFIKILAKICSYLLFGKEHVEEILKEIAVNKLAGNDNVVILSMKLLKLFGGSFPAICDGLEKDLVELLKDDDDHIKEGIVHILARNGGAIHENMIDINGSADLLLEKLCLEGSRKQAKYAVQAIVAITKDSQLSALSALYERLVDMLESDDHLATILQSLGSIAQIAMPVFETQEEKIIQFVCRRLLRKSSNPVDVSKTEWEDRSQVCWLKICGIKTLVKSYLPNKDAQSRKRVKALFGVLTKIISTGEISEEVKSSIVDRAHLKLAAAIAVLRLSRQWDSHVTPQLFYLTLRTAQDSCTHVRKQFLAKVHQYLRDGTLDNKYACAFMLNIPVATKHELLEARQYLVGFFETCHGATQSNQHYSNSYKVSQENVLCYLIHALAHHPDFPVSEYGSSGEAFEPFYQQLYFFLSVALQQDRSRNYGHKKANGLDNITLFMTIFRTIKTLEDAIDKSKTENLYTLCDLGLLITKDFTDKEVNIGSSPISTSFPPYYKKSEEIQDIDLKVDGSHLPACLVRDDVLAQFKTKVLPQESEKQYGSPYGNVVNDCENGDREEQILERINSQRTEENDASTPLKRKRGRPRKGTTEIVSQGMRQIFAGNSNSLNLSQRKLRPQRIYRYIQDVQKDMELPDLILVSSEGAQNDLSKLALMHQSNTKQDHMSKKLQDLSSDHQKDLFETISKGIESSQCMQGCPNKLERISTSEGNIKLSDGLLGESNYNMQLEENQNSEQISGKDLKGLGASHDKDSRTSEQSKSTITIEVLGKNKSADDNFLTSSAETSDPPKRKRGRPSKGTAGLVSQKPIQGLEKMNRDELKVCQPNRRSSRYKSFAQRETEFSNLKLVTSKTAQNGISATALISSKVLDNCKTGQDLLSMRYSDLPSLDHQRGPPGLESTQSRPGRPRGLRERSNAKPKLKLPDLTREANERLSDGFLGAELIPDNMWLEENKGSGQSMANNLKSRVDTSCDKFSEKVVQNEVETAENNIMAVVAKSSISYKRKRSYLSKGTTNLASQDTRQCSSGNDTNDLKLFQPEQGYKADIQKATDCPACRQLMYHSDELIKSNKFPSHRSSLRLKIRYAESSDKGEHKENQITSDNVPGIIVIANHDKGSKTTMLSKSIIPEGVSTEVFLADNNIGVIKRKRGRPSKAKADLAFQEFEKGLSGNDKDSKRRDKNLLGSPKVSTEIQCTDSTSENGCLHKKMSGNLLEHIRKSLQNDGYKVRETVENTFKRKSISPMKKRASKEFEKKDVGEELVGQRIKVWWPLDKKYYAGVVESYDTKQKKHKIIYEDGDLEVLRLGKEKWAPIDGQT